jgi:hypothetical protein
MSSSAGPRRSQQLEILPSLNSKEFFSSACFSCRAIIFMDATILPGATDFRAAMVLTSAMVLPSAMILPSAIRIASYRHLRVGNVGGEYGYLLLKGTNATLQGVFQVTLFCPGPRRTQSHKTVPLSKN